MILHIITFLSEYSSQITYIYINNIYPNFALVNKVSLTIF